METRKWDKRSFDMALCESNLEIESQRLELNQAYQWADQAQGERISLCGDWEMRNRLFNGSRARDCQEIEELRRNRWGRAIKK